MRSTYRTRARYFVDSSREDYVTWIRLPRSARPLPLPTLLNSVAWEKEEGELPQDQFEVGSEAARDWTTGAYPAHFGRAFYAGSADQFARGLLLSDLAAPAPEPDHFCGPEFSRACRCTRPSSPPWLLAVRSSAELGAYAAGCNVQTTLGGLRNSFTAPDGTALQSYVPDSGPAWTVQGTWTITGGTVFNSAAGNDVCAYQSTGPGNGDFTLEADMIFPASGWNGGIIFNVVDSENFWLLDSGGFNDQWRLWMKVNGNYQAVLGYGIPAKANGSQHVKIQTAQQYVYVWIDGARQADYWHPYRPNMNGLGVGIRTDSRGGTSPRWDNVTVPGAGGQQHFCAERSSVLRGRRVAEHVTTRILVQSSACKCQRAVTLEDYFRAEQSSACSCRRAPGSAAFHVRGQYASGSSLQTVIYSYFQISGARHSEACRVSCAQSTPAPHVLASTGSAASLGQGGGALVRPSPIYVSRGSAEHAATSSAAPLLRGSATSSAKLQTSVGGTYHPAGAFVSATDQQHAAMGSAAFHVHAITSSTAKLQTTASSQMHAIGPIPV